MFVSLYRGDMAALQRCTYVVGLLGSLRVRIAEQEEQEHTQHILVHSCTVLVNFLRLYEYFFSTSYSYGWNLFIQITKCLGPSSGWARLLVGLADLPVWTRVMQPRGCLGRVHGRFHTNGKRIYSSVLLSVSQFSFFKKSKGCSYIHLRLLPYDMVFRRQVMLVNSTCCGAEPLLRGAQIQPQLIAA